MEFHTEEIQQCEALFDGGFPARAERQISLYLQGEPTPVGRLEALALSLRIQVERFNANSQSQLIRQATELLNGPTLSACGFYHLGITFLLCEDLVSADQSFRKCEESSRNKLEQSYAHYGYAMVAYNRKTYNRALSLLSAVEKRSPDIRVLSASLCGNCHRALGQWDEAYEAYMAARTQLPYVEATRLKYWVIYGLAIAQSRRGEVSQAQAMLESLRSIVHPEYMGRLHQLCEKELMRMAEHADVVFDPITGDLSSKHGALSLRGKPTLIKLLQKLIDSEGQTVSKDALYRYVWSGEYHPLRHDGLLYSHMQRLRKLLSLDKILSHLILTNREGYTLNPDLRCRIARAGLLQTIEKGNKSYEV